MNFPGLIRDFDVTPETATTIICVLLAALVLTQYTRIRGVSGFAINSILLLVGAFGAVYLTRGMDLPVVGYFIQRTLVISFAGIMASSLLVLLLFSRPNRE
jgi:hypothetical protein